MLFLLSKLTSTLIKKVNNENDPKAVFGLKKYSVFMNLAAI